MPRGRGRPEVLGGRGSPRRTSRNLTVFNPERIEVDVLDVGVCDAPEVACDGRLRADPDEERLCRGAFAADPYLPEPAVVPDPIRSTGVDLESLARQRVARCRKPLGRRLQVAALALGLVDPEKEAAACRQRKPEQGDDAAEDDENDAAGAQCCLPVIESPPARFARLRPRVSPRAACGKASVARQRALRVLHGRVTASGTPEAVRVLGYG